MLNRRHIRSKTDYTFFQAPVAEILGLDSEEGKCRQSETSDRGDARHIGQQRGARPSRIPRFKGGQSNLRQAQPCVGEFSLELRNRRMQVVDQRLQVPELVGCV